MTILDYMDWRGDLPFDKVDFCEVDALIFTWIIYYTAEDLQAKGVALKGMTIREMAQAHVQTFGPLKVVDPMKKPFPSDNAELLLEHAAETDRFGSVIIEDFAAMAGGMSGVQYASASYLLSDGSRVVAYRGTDTTVAGWKENFRMAFETKIPAQLLAAAYLEKMSDGRKTVVCGHSKGGNLAVYAALNCRERTEETLDKIYNFDGPGFGFEWRNSEKYLRLKDRIVTIVPQETIVGALLDHAEDYCIIASDMSHFFQHNAFCWHVRRTQFVRVEERTQMSLAIERTLQGWLGNLNRYERKEFVDTAFGLFDFAGVTDTRELMEDPARKGKLLLQGMLAWPPHQKEQVGKLVVELLRQFNLPVAATMVEKLVVKGENA